MKQRSLFCVLLVLAAGQAVFAEGLEFSGLLDTTIQYDRGAGDAPAHTWGIEEYANIRLKSQLRERAVFYGAFNLIAASGSSVMGGEGFIVGENFAAAIELERLYFRVNGDHVDTEAGLLRLPFGYGQVWGSSDFLNSRNPLAPDARSRAVLGSSFSLYPTDDLKLQLFAAAPKNPLETKGDFLPGFSLDQHWSRASLQTLYAFEIPRDGIKYGMHRFGLSLKADIELGFVADALYTLNPADLNGIEGLSTGAGFDYSFFDGAFYVLAEYLYNGSVSSTAQTSGFSHHHYLYGSLQYRFNDYTSLSLGDMFCFDDVSQTVFLALEHELFQGFSLSLSCQLPLERDGFIQNGRSFMTSSKVRLRI
jgi:hypothetical protein